MHSAFAWQMRSIQNRSRKKQSSGRTTTEDDALVPGTDETHELRKINGKLCVEVELFLECNCSLSWRQEPSQRQRSQGEWECTWAARPPSMSSSGRFLRNQGCDRMPEMEMRLLGLAWKILDIRSTHSRDRARFAGKLYFTPMIRCSTTMLVSPAACLTVQHCFSSDQDESAHRINYSCSLQHVHACSLDRHATCAHKQSSALHGSG